MLHKDLVGTDLHVSKIHADTHEAAGTDPLVLAESQVTALVTDLAGKAPTVHVHVKADITDFPTLGSGTVTAVTGTSPVVSSEGATPAISIPAATNAAPGYATAAQITALEAATAAQHAAATIGTGNGLSIAGQAISLAAATASVPGAATAAQITKLDGIAAGATANVGTVTGVTATAPVTSSGGAAPVIALPAATASVDGYETKEQVTKLDGIAAGATANVGTVTGVTGTAPVASSGGAAPAISMAAATASVDGYATKEQITKLDGVAAGAKVGDVVGPASATDGHLAVFDTTTGKLLKDGGAVPAGGGDVVGPASSFAGHFLTFVDTTGKLVQDGGVVPVAVDLTPIDLNIIDLAINLETLKGSILTGVAANIFVETFQALTDITLSHGTYDAVNKKVYLS